MAFGDMVLEGQLPELAGDSPWYASGANIVRWPAAGWLHAAVLADKASEGALCAAECVLKRQKPCQVVDSCYCHRPLLRGVLADRA